MGLLHRARQGLVGLSRSLPAYRLIPSPRHRDYAAVHYLQKTRPAEIPKYLITTGRLPDLRLSTLRMAARAAFDQGRDELLERILDRARQRYPEDAETHILQADLAAFQGHYEQALQAAETAWLLTPDSADAARRTVRLAAMNAENGPGEATDQLSLDAMRAFPHAGPVLWAACKNCASRAQFQRIHELWREQCAGSSQAIAAGGRPIANAALRAGECGTALDILAETALLELRGEGVGTPVREKRLRGRRSRSVIEDLREVLDSAGIRWFLAAGTALGIIRDGRPLDHDSDIDVGVFDQDWDRERIVQAFRAHPAFDFDLPHPHNPKLGLIHRAGAAIDLFRYYREGEFLYHDGVFVRWFNRPFELEEHQFGKKRVLVPANPEQYLTENYGDWRTPDPEFDAFVEGPNAETKWPEYQQVHRMRRAYKFIRAHDFLRAREELGHIRTSLEQSVHGPELARELAL